MRSLSEGQILICRSTAVGPGVLETDKLTYRARLPSLYSDFSTQRHTNPDGYATNAAAWQRALAHAALAGVIHSSSGSRHHGDDGVAKSDLLVLRTGNALMAELETQEWGRPVALQSAIVCYRDTYIHSLCVLDLLLLCPALRFA